MIEHGDSLEITINKKKGLVLVLFLVAGCQYQQAGPQEPLYQYYEMIDKSALPNPTEESFYQYWRRIDVHCMSRIRNQYESYGFNSESQIYSMYRNCMGSNNFELIDPSYVDLYVARNKIDYGISFVIEKVW
tara:strand:- start:166 stop:561 length:396 start_codon:yes stop_codon:yes gene_type:complete